MKAATVMRRTFAALGSSILALTLTLHGSASLAEGSDGIIDSSVRPAAQTHESSSTGFGNGSFVVAPIPFSNPTIGSGLALGLGYLFQMDATSKPSVIGVAGLRSDNGSMAAGVAGNIYFRENRWILSLLAAEANVQYDLYTGLGILPIQQEGILGRVSLSYGVTPQLSFGASVRYLDTTISLARPGHPPIPPPYNRFLNVQIANVGLVAEWDTRDDSIYPTGGHLLSFQAAHGIALSGLVQDYQKSYVNFSKYYQPYDRGVIAARASLCAASQETPFFDQCGLGTTDGFRGFSATQFLDFRLASLQLELRHRFTSRIGAVVFGGLGQTGSSFDTLDAGGTHSAYGVGVRYRVSKKFPLDFSVDFSRNNLSEDSIYIYVGQRF